MGVALHEFERSAPFAGDYPAALASVRERLSRLQLAQAVHRARAIILFDGWEGSGRKAVVKLLAGALDPCHLSVCRQDLREGPDGRHWLARYWSRLPRSGDTCLFFGSWYSDAVGARLVGDLADKAWARTSDEINEFEAQQTDHGTILVKLFFHVAPQVQAARLAARSEDPWLRWTLAEGPGGLAARAAAQPLWEQILSRSNTRWAPWTIVDGGDEQAAAIAALGAIAGALEKGVPADPPAAGETVVPISSSLRA